MLHFLSIIIPVYNEEENLKDLNNKICSALNEFGYDFEIIYVNDGSIDASFDVLKNLAEDDEHIKVINFIKNYGQSAALQAGIDLAKGDVIIPMDADLQNDPYDIKKMVEVYDKGFDIVSGRRRNRHDNIIRVLPSKVANFIISNITGVKLHDFGCTLKIYNAELLKRIRLYGELHRFIPVLFTIYSGGRNFTEIEVTHHKRKFGSSKYNLSRTLRVVLDLFTIAFLQKFADRPMQFFGGCALILFFISIFSLCISLYAEFDYLFLALFISGWIFFGVAFIVLMIGILAELLMRNYYELSDKRVYKIKDVI